MGGGSGQDSDPCQPATSAHHESTSLPLRSGGEVHRNQRLSPLQRGDLDLLPMEMTTSGVRCSSVVYKLSSQAYGAQPPPVLTSPVHGLSSRSAVDSCRHCWLLLHHRRRMPFSSCWLPLLLLLLRYSLADTAAAGAAVLLCTHRSSCRVPQASASIFCC